MKSMTILGMIGPWQVVLIVLVVLILFGGKKIPELMKGLGKGMKEFKDATKEIDKDKEKSWVEKQKIFFGVVYVDLVNKLLLEWIVLLSI